MSLQRLYGVFIGLRPGLGRNDRSCLQLDLAGRIEQIGDEDTTVFMAATMSSSLIAQFLECLGRAHERARRCRSWHNAKSWRDSMTNGYDVALARRRPRVACVHRPRTLRYLAARSLARLDDDQLGRAEADNPREMARLRGWCAAWRRAWQKE
jgi:hypothetical protein